MKPGASLACGMGIALLAVGSAAAEDKCSDVLQNGTFSRSELQDNSYFQQIVWSRFLKSTYQSSKTDKSGGFRVPIGELVLGGNYSEADYNARKAQIEKAYFGQINASRELSVMLTSGDEEIVGAWETCMTQRGGLSIRFDPVSATDVFMILEYRLQGANNRVRLLDDIKFPEGVTVADGARCVRRGAWITAGNPCRARLSLESATTIAAVAANASGASADAFLPARIERAVETKPYVFSDAQRLEDLAHKRVAQHSATVALTADEIRNGWMFVPASAQTNLQRISVDNSNNRCMAEFSNPGPYVFTYGYTIYAPNRHHHDGHVRCAMTPYILMQRDVWVAMADVDDRDDKKPASSAITRIKAVLGQPALLPTDRKGPSSQPATMPKLEPAFTPAAELKSVLD